MVQTNWLVYATVKKEKKKKNLKKKYANGCVIWNTVPTFWAKKRKEKKHTFSNTRNLWWNKNIRLEDLAEASKLMIEVNETRENYDAAVYGYTFLLLTPFSFVKLFKKMIDELQLY